MQREIIPRLPVFGWQSLQGRQQAGVPCMLDLPGLHYSTSGRASILLALEALGVGRGDRVLLPTYHCPTMVAPAARLGAIPEFYPIDAHGSPDLAWLDRQKLQGVRVLLAAHYFGLPQPMERISRWCAARGIALIEDCAHALFGRSGQRPVGTWGDVAIGSLTKFLPVPEGGCLILNTDRGALRSLTPCGTATHAKAAVDILEVGAAQGQIAGVNGLVTNGLAALRRLRALRYAPAAPKESDAALEAVAATAEFSLDVAMAHRALAWPCRWMAKTLPRERIVQRRRRYYELLSQRLGQQLGLLPLRPELPPDCAPYVFPLWVEEPDPSYAELRRLGMPVFRWDRLWPGVPVIEGDCGLEWSHHVLQLACHQDLTNADIERFVQALLRLYGRPAAGDRPRLAPLSNQRLPA